MDASAQPATSRLLLTSVCEFLEAEVRDYPFPSVDGSACDCRVFLYGLPEGLEEKTYPFVIARWMEGEITNEPGGGSILRDTVVLALGVYAPQSPGQAGLSLLYKAPEIIFERVEQRQESDLAFLQRVTTDQGLRLCLRRKEAIIYSGQKADELEPLEFERADFPFAGVNFRRTLDAVYTRCVVGYTDADKSETTEKEFQPENENLPEAGKTLTLNKRIENPAQAERLAKAELRDKNCKEMTGSFSGMGDTRLLAGTVVRLSGWGQFDSDYVIGQATHSVSQGSGYTVSCELVKALDY